ncbi:uncharacterized protein LOC106647030 [Copidosoma floridanum]|uniref:uncharacterized protein LOC106647030 n=1 Tax=Copidosoma floridanum TaxID=29053 RepID=UPI0006C96CB6|nr:uncharacterized protein LOC106647030 [Copidosoma floridanum]
MKFFLSFAVVLYVTTFATYGEAIPNQRSKRAISIENCPDDKSKEGKCKDYFEEQLQMYRDQGQCIDYVGDDTQVQWQTCGSVLCSEDLVKRSDPSKPYPDCCPKCYHPYE